MRLGALCLGLTLRTIVQSASPRQEISQIRSHNRPQSASLRSLDWGYEKLCLSEAASAIARQSPNDCLTVDKRLFVVRRTIG